MKTKHYWKVVSIGDGGNFYSALEKDPRCQLTYKIGKITRPKLGKIFVFLTRESARNWRHYHYNINGNDVKILKVKPMGKVEKANASVCVDDFFNMKKDFWENYLRGIVSGMGSLVPPDNTYYADAVLPLEIV